MALGAVLALSLAAGRPTEGDRLGTFVLLTACAAATQLFAIQKPGNRVFHAGLLFVVAATVLLPPILVAAMCLLQHIPDWIRHRYRWYIQTFNICNYVASAMAASSAVAAVEVALPPGQVGLAGSGLAAALVFLLANRILLGVMLKLGRGVSLKESGLFGFEDLAVECVLGVMGVRIAISLVHEPWIVPLGLAPLVVIYYLQLQAREITDASDTIRRQNDSLADVNELLRERTIAAMEGLAATVDARDSYTAGHARRVQRLSLLLAGELELDADEREVVATAALFHDIGKIAIPDAVLLKPGRLDEREWETMQTHSEEGARIIARLGFLDDAVPAIRHHHERMNGSGYPDRLVGDEIPLAARIIHLADALDSMLTHRVYSSPRQPDDAVAEVRWSTGEQFCPRCVDALERLIAREGVGVVAPQAAVAQIPEAPRARSRRPEGESSRLARARLATR
ncbi:MAG: HD-GYP domain-containing protein [Actinomycetota bacterium]|nr:HD-GYP domain-containing protein [Actinomycetota bacterium]